jgi:hypothetical protein
MVPVWCALVSALLLLAALHAGAGEAAAPTTSTPAHVQPKVTPFEAGDVRALPLVYAPPGSRPRYRRRLRSPVEPKVETALPPAEVADIGSPLAPMPPPIRNFAGMSYGDSCTGGLCGGGWPPDPNGDVGVSHYIQAVNTAYAIYDKTGALLASFTEDQLWSAAGANECNGNSQGDPVALYDRLAKRWILTHFAFAVNGSNDPISPFFQCIAASKTSDPVAGGWWLYPVRMDPGGPGLPPVGALNDYGKFGVWTDCLYGAANEFTFPGGDFIGTAFASFSRSDLFSGTPLTWSLGFLGASGPATMIPSNLTGRSLPPAGTPSYFVSESRTLFTFEVRKFTAGPNCGGGSLSAATDVSQTSYSFPSGAIVPQPGTANALDAIDDRLMQKMQYRKIGAAESLWVVHNVGTAPVTIQWAQLDVTGGVIAATPVQEQIFAPDTALHRWMGSLAADSQGNMAVGYSTSSSASFPSIAYAGRLVGDPLGTLPQAEVLLATGAGSQTNTCGGDPCDRWGDYTAMSVDPADDCTFWYTNEYYSSPANGTSGNWQTRIGSFKFPSCVGTAPPVIFADVPAGHFARTHIEALYNVGVTGGCATNLLRYCPDSAVTREQMAVFLVKAVNGAGFTPPACTTAPFADVPCSSPFAPWIQALVDAEVTAGCGAGLYCPTAVVTREQMAVFLLKAHDGAAFSPPPCTTAPFADVPCSSLFARWIRELVNRGITAGCAAGLYCPTNPVTRAEMAIFIVKTFKIPF